VRTLASGFTSHLAGRSHTRCNMLLLILRDGSNIGITDHDKDLDFNLSDAGVGSVTYRAGTGILTSDVSLQAGLDADNYEVTGPVDDDDFTIERIVGGRFNRARAYLFQVNWKDLTLGDLPILAGNVSEARIAGGKFTFEIRSDCDRFNQTVGRLIVNNCDADFADGVRCNATAVEVVGTVTAVTDEMRFTVSYTGSYANDFFNIGTVEALTGDLAGTAPVEIHDWTVGGAITLFAPLAERPAIGDTFNVRQGCPKNRAACIGFGAILDFRGFPEVPGSDKILRATIPGQTNG
jgi:uncharacterized phage protein (TIGR02218 family)